MPSKSYSWCTPTLDLNLVIKPVNSLISTCIDGVKRLIPAGTFKVNRLALENFELGGILNGGTTTLSVDVDLIKGFNKKFQISAGWSWLQPMITGLSTWKAKAVAWVKTQGNALKQDMIKFAIQLACEAIESLCIDIPAGGFINKRIDFPSWANAVINDITIKIPSKKIGPYCLKSSSSFPKFLTDALKNHYCRGRRLNVKEASDKDFTGEICFEGVKNDGQQPDEVTNTPEGWHVVPVPAEHLQTNATHTTYCWLTEPEKIGNAPGQNGGRLLRGVQSNLSAHLQALRSDILESELGRTIGSDPQEMEERDEEEDDEDINI